MFSPFYNQQQQQQQHCALAKFTVSLNENKTSQHSSSSSTTFFLFFHLFHRHKQPKARKKVLDVFVTNIQAGISDLFQLTHHQYKIGLFTQELLI